MKSFRMKLKSCLTKSDGSSKPRSWFFGAFKGGFMKFKDRVLIGIGIGIGSAFLFTVAAYALFNYSNPVEAKALDSSKSKAFVDRHFTEWEELALLGAEVSGSKGQALNENKVVLSVKRYIDGFLDNGVLQSKGLDNVPQIVQEEILKGIKDIKENRLFRGEERVTHQKLNKILNSYDFGSRLIMSSSVESGVHKLRLTLHEIAKLDLLEVDHKTRQVLLYLVGDIGIRLWMEEIDSMGIVTFVYLITEYPETELARMAWVRLNSHIHFGYTGSSGDHTPVAWLNFLSELRDHVLDSSQKMYSMAY